MALLVAGALLFTLVTTVNTVILEAIYTPLAKNHGIYLPLWVWILGPSLAVVGLYPLLGVPIVSERYDDPFYRWAIVLQVVYGPFVLLGPALVIEVVIVHLAQLLVLGVVRPSWVHVAFLFYAIPTAFVGVWGGLVFYWLWNRVRPESQQTTG